MAYRTWAARRRGRRRWRRSSRRPVQGDRLLVLRTQVVAGIGCIFRRRGLRRSARLAIREDVVGTEGGGKGRTCQSGSSRVAAASADVTRSSPSRTATATTMYARSSWLARRRSRS